jgi:hypothetical protein
MRRLLLREQMPLLPFIRDVQSMLGEGPYWVMAVN